MNLEITQNEKYACYVEYGTFSNTATNDSNLIVYIMVDSDDAIIHYMNMEVI